MKKFLLFFAFSLTITTGEVSKWSCIHGSNDSQEAFGGDTIAQEEIVFEGDNVCLRRQANENPGSKWSGNSAPHFFNGDRLPCVGTVGDYYKVVYNNKEYYAPKKHARLYEPAKETVVQGAIVNVRKQLYSYQEMLEDLDLLQQKYPDVLSYVLEGKTYQGRRIPIVTLGNPKAQKFIMVQSAMHAREYLSAQLVMAMIEHYASNYQSGKYKNNDLKSILNEVCFIIIPMTNPDGVEIAQQGENGAVTPEVKQWVRQNTSKGIRFDQIKSNARGVDINRNFNNGFGKDPNRKPQKGYSHFPGTEPYSEFETKFLLDVSKRHDYSLFLNYHTSGNVIYYGCGNAAANVKNI